MGGALGEEAGSLRMCGSRLNMRGEDDDVGRDPPHNRIIVIDLHPCVGAVRRNGRVCACPATLGLQLHRPITVTKKGQSHREEGGVRSSCAAVAVRIPRNAR